MKLPGTRTIETERLILRKYVMEDAEDMYNNWASDDEVTKYLTWPPHQSIETTKQVLEDWISRYPDDGFMNWAIEYKQTRQVIGNISVVRLNRDIMSADIGYCMSRTLWGNGIMPEALKAVIDYLFEAGMNRVAACHDANNPKSGRCMEKAGMKYEGTLLGAGKNNQGIIDEVWRSILRDEWSDKGNG